MPPEWQFGLPLGHFGVQLFFVLSGFLVTKVLLREKGADGVEPKRVARVFFFRRVLRIFPAYFFLLLVLWYFDVSHARRDVVWHLLFFSNVRIFLSGDFNTLLAHFWTVCVEEQYYLIWPWLILWTSRPLVIRITIAILIAAPLFRILMFASVPQLPATVLLPGVADAFAAGALSAILETSGRLAQRYRQFQVGICLPIFLVLQSIAAILTISPNSEAVRQTSMVIVFALLVSKAATGIRSVPGRMLESKPAIYIGKISYGIYLVHNFIPHVLGDGSRFTGREWTSLASTSPWTRCAILLSATVAVASVSWVVVERPILKLKRFFPYRRNK